MWRRAAWAALVGFVVVLTGIKTNLFVTADRILVRTSSMVTKAGYMNAPSRIFIGNTWRKPKVGDGDTIGGQPPYDVKPQRHLCVRQHYRSVSLCPTRELKRRSERLARHSEGKIVNNLKGRRCSSVFQNAIHANAKKWNRRAIASGGGIVIDSFEENFGLSRQGYPWAIRIPHYAELSLAYPSLNYGNYKQEDGSRPNYFGPFGKGFGPLDQITIKISGGFLLIFGVVCSYLAIWSFAFWEGIRYRWFLFGAAFIGTIFCTSHGGHLLGWF